MHDVTIVGAGPVGLLLGCRLAALGVDTCVLEARTERTAHSRAIGVHPPALAEWARLGLAGDLIDAGVPVRRGILRSGGADIGSLTFDRASPLYPFVLTVPQHRTELLLERRFDVLAPGALVRGFPVRTVRRCADHIELGGPAGSIDTRYAVGADGPGSTVRAASGIAVRDAALTDTYLMGDFADDTGDGARAVIHVEPGGVVESFPLPDAMRRWVVRTGELCDGSTPAELTELFGARTGARVDPATNTMISAFRARSRLAAGMVAGRSIVIGDAAHEISPIGGQGMNLGWLDAAELAPVLAALVRRERAGNPREAGRALTRFERRRLRSARAADRQARVNMALGRELSGVRLIVRDRALRAALATPLRTPMARAFTMRRR